MPALADIENAVTAQNTVIDSVAVLLNHLTDQIAAANRSGDSDTIARIIGEIQDGTARLTTAVTANTPGGPAVVTPLPVAAAPDPVVAPLPVEAGVKDTLAPTADEMAANTLNYGHVRPVYVSSDPVDTSVETPPALVQITDTTPSNVPPVVDNIVDTPPAE